MKFQKTLTILTAFLSLCSTAFCDRRLKSPKEAFGFNIGDDYQLANYKQLTSYWKDLEKHSNRIKILEIGKTEEGRTMLMAVISSPKNLKKLDEYRAISADLAHGRISQQEAQKLSEKGKAIVWIDGGLHANEVLGAQQLIETVYQLVSGDDPETRRILDDDIVLAVLANPDGMDLVSDWYMRSADPLKRSTSNLPRLYQKYIGHDNNRDFFASTQSETRAMNAVMYQQWFPQIVYNHHQTGPAGTVLFMPPFRDPFNYRFDPLIPAGIDTVGAAMATRLLEENKPGATTRSGSPYSTWWNGGLRTTCYFHNMIGLLTETIGNPTPITIPFIAAKQLPKADLISPIPPQVWHFRQSVDYSVSANKAVLDIASKHRQQFLFNIWRMGHNSIERGNRDSWTISPHQLQSVVTERGAVAIDKLHTAEARDPRGYIIPRSQKDFPTACKFVQTLLDNGIEVEQATEDFTVAGKTYGKGSLIVRCAQAFRPHILDMFEAQDHPDDFAYPGGPPVPPYDIAGWTLAMQMGIQYDRVMDSFNIPAKIVVGTLSGGDSEATISDANWFTFPHDMNDSFTVVNRLLRSGKQVYWMKDGINSGKFAVAKSLGLIDLLKDYSKSLGVTFTGMNTMTGKALALKSGKTALWDRYGGSIESGWTRFVLEKFEFPFEVVFPPSFDAGNLNSKYTSIVFPNGAVNVGRGRGAVNPDEPNLENTVVINEDNIPIEYRGRRGSISQNRTIPQIRSFIESGGTVVTVGSSWSLSNALGINVRDGLIDPATGRRLVRDKFYVPGSVLQTKVDNSLDLSAGLKEIANVFFESSPSFLLPNNYQANGIEKVAWYDSERPLLSGWAWGQKALKDTVAAFTAKIGKGHLNVFGPEITFRSQPHGTFKWLFNSILLSNSEPIDLK